MPLCLGTSLFTEASLYSATVKTLILIPHLWVNINVCYNNYNCCFLYHVYFLLPKYGRTLQCHNHKYVPAALCMPTFYYLLSFFPSIFTTYTIIMILVSDSIVFIAKLLCINSSWNVYTKKPIITHNNNSNNINSSEQESWWASEDTANHCWSKISLPSVTLGILLIVHGIWTKWFVVGQAYIKGVLIWQKTCETWIHTTL